MSETVEKVGTGPMPHADALRRELNLRRSQVATLEQLLEVHEQTSLEQTTRLEEALRGLDNLLEREREARAAELESEQRLRLALDAGRMGTWEWNIENGHLIWSAEEERLYGLAAGSFSGSLDEYRSRIHPEDRDAALSGVRAAIDARATTHQILHRIVRPSGEIRWLDSRARFIYGTDGRAKRLVGVSTDVTEQRQLETALREREAEFRSMANSIPQLAWMAEADGTIYWYNQRWYDFTGTTLDAMKRFGWQPLQHPEHLQRVAERFTASIREGIPWEDTFPLLGADGSYRWFLSRAEPIRDESGRVTRWFGTNTDVTDRLEVEAERDRALAEARAERSRLYDVFMQAPAAIAVLEGEKDVFTVANALYRELVGGRQLLGRSLREAFPELAGQGFYELVERVRTSGEAFSTSEMLVRLDRNDDGVLEDLYIDFVYQPLSRPDGAVFGIMVHAVDVTSQVAARRRIEALAAEREAILGQIADVVVTTDTTGAVTFYNLATRAIYGEMVTGLPIWDERQPFTLLRADGSTRPMIGTPLARAIAGERVVNEEWRIRRSDGTEMELLGSAVPIFASDGHALGAAMTVRDITSQRQLQRQLEHERSRLQQILMEAPASISVSEGPDHLVVMQNAISRTMSGGRDLVGHRARDIFPELANSGIFELQDEVFRSGTPFVGREMLVLLDRDNDGEPEPGYFNFVYQPLHDSRDKVYGILTHAVEVTDQVLARQQVEQKAEELARLTQELERSNKELDQFAYVASHDLKAPLRGIANLAQWIEEDLGGAIASETVEHMRLLKGRVNRMEALIDGILAYSRAGRVRDEPEQVDVGKLVAEGIELLAPPAGVEVVVGERMPSIVTERIPLQQVFMNLIGNAIKYGRGEGARVVISAIARGDRYEFSVADNGPGIAPQYRERIWQIFQTLAPRDKVEGTGIGLSVVRKIVEARGGTAWLESEVGQGTTFYFTWPKGPGTTP